MGIKWHGLQIRASGGNQIQMARIVNLRQRRGFIFALVLPIMKKMKK